MGWIAFLAVWGFQVLGAIWPTSYWFDVRSVDVNQPAHSGQPIQMTVIRSVNREFLGRYSVIVEPLGEDTIECDGFGELTYQPRRQLPDPLTLEWWVGEPCDLAPGDYHMQTKWDVKGTNFDAFDKEIVWDTYFRVSEAPPEIAQQIAPEPLLSIQLEQQQQAYEELRDQFEQLSSEIENLK